jgi:hypothetical protein
MVRTMAAALGLSACLLSQGAVADAAQRAPAGTGKKPIIVMLGTGTPRPLPDAWGPSRQW